MSDCLRCSSIYSPKEISLYGQRKYPGLCMGCIFFIVDDIASANIPLPESAEWQEELDNGPDLKFDRCNSH